MNRLAVEQKRQCKRRGEEENRGRTCPAWEGNRNMGPHREGERAVRRRADRTRVRESGRRLSGRGYRTGKSKVKKKRREQHTCTELAAEQSSCFY